MARIPRKFGLGQSRLHSIQNMWEHHKEIARRLLLGERQMDIARDMKLSQNWISIVCSSPAFIKYLDGLRARTEVGISDVRKEITAGAVEGIKVLRSLLTSSNEQIQLKAATDLLDRDGFGAVKRVEQQVSGTVHLTADRLEELKARRNQMLQESKVIQIN